VVRGAPLRSSDGVFTSAIFAIATGLSRIAGLAREILASSYFGTQGRFSAFTIAFQVPNLVRSLFADAAISAAFVPVFTELLEHGRKREAFRLLNPRLCGPSRAHSRQLGHRDDRSLAARDVGFAVAVVVVQDSDSASSPVLPLKFSGCAG